MICKSCKHLVSNSDRYCTHCGMNNPNYIDKTKSHESHVFGEHKVYEKDRKRKSKRGTYFIAYFAMWRRIVDFRGTTKRDEFFTALLIVIASYFFVFSRIFSLLSNGQDVLTYYLNNPPILYIIYTLFMVVAISSMIIRRIHDTGNSAVYLVLLIVAPLAYFLSIEARLVIWAILGMIFGYILAMPSHDNIYQVFDPEGYNEK